MADHTRVPEPSPTGTTTESLFGVTDDATQATFDEVQPGLFPDDSIPDGTSGYRVPIACQIAGITYRQLDYWARTDLVVPSIRNAAGSGSQRLYSFKDILVLKIVKQLLDTGISLQNIRKAVDQIRSRGVQDLANITLFSDGRTIFECTSKEEVFDLLQGGQGVFGIGIGGAMRELAGSISEFPSEQVDDGAAAAAVVEDELAARRRARATRRTGRLRPRRGGRDGAVGVESVPRPIEDARERSRVSTPRRRYRRRRRSKSSPGNSQAHGTVRPFGRLWRAVTPPGDRPPTGKAGVRPRGGCG